MTEWSTRRFSPNLNWLTYVLYWRDIVVAECKSQDSDAFTGKNKFRVALLRTTYFPVSLQALMVLHDAPRQMAVLAAFPIYVGMLEGQLSLMLSLSSAAAAVSIPVQRDPSAYTDPLAGERQVAEEAAVRAGAAANRLNIRFTSLTDPNGDSVQVYLREVSISEAHLLLEDEWTFTLEGVKELESFARAVLESAYEFMVERTPETLSALQIEVQQASASLTDLVAYLDSVARPASKPAGVGASLPQTPTPSRASSSGCFVATAVYGSYDCPEVRILRRWRDAALLPNRPGRALVGTYYAISPHLVRAVGARQWFGRPLRQALDRLVVRLRRSGIEDGPYRDVSFPRDCF